MTQTLEPSTQQDGIAGPQARVDAWLADFESALIARDHGGPFAEYKVNEAPFLRVIGKHRDASYFLIHFDIEPAQVREIERGLRDGQVRAVVANDMPA